MCDYHGLPFREVRCLGTAGGTASVFASGIAGDVASGTSNFVPTSWNFYSSSHKLIKLKAKNMVFLMSFVVR